MTKEKDIKKDDQETMKDDAQSHDTSGAHNESSEGVDHTEHKKDKKGKKIKIAEEQLHALENKAKELDDLKDNLLRRVADFDNAKKRLTREKGEFVKFANEKVIAAFLPVIDNLDRALAHGDNAVTTDSLVSGITLIRKQIFSILKDNGLSEVEAIGHQFDPHFHEAIGTVETEEHAAGTIVDEVQRGYMYKDRLLRPSWVRVAAAHQEEVSSSDEEHRDEEHDEKNNVT